jgi:hypothetical protein
MDIKLAVAVFIKDGKRDSTKTVLSRPIWNRGEKRLSDITDRVSRSNSYTGTPSSLPGLIAVRQGAKTSSISILMQHLQLSTWPSTTGCPTKKTRGKPFSMANYKTLYNNTLMLERFMCRFAINPNTAKNQKIVKELLDFGKIAA